MAVIIDKVPQVAARPTGGQGLALTAQGKIPPSLLAVPAGTNFPATPVDGQEYVYAADAANGVFWRFRWYNAGPFWTFVGGPPLFAEITTSETTTSATYAALATAGPSITLPFAGDYDVAIGASFNAEAADSLYMSYAIGGTGAVDADAIDPGAGAGGFRFPGMRPRRKTGLSAVTLTAKYRSADGVTIGHFANRWMSVTPVKK